MVSPPDGLHPNPSNAAEPEPDVEQRPNNNRDLPAQQRRSWQDRTYACGHDPGQAVAPAKMLEGLDRTAAIIAIVAAAALALISGSEIAAKVVMLMLWL
jgi:hypothetical protein